MPPNSQIRITKNGADFFRAAAAEFSQSAVDAVRLRGRFTVALSGGSTPRALYTLLSAGDFAIPWSNSYFFWGDERHVPPDDPESNYRLAYEAMLSKVPVPPGNIFRIHGEEKDAQVAAQQYEQTLMEFFHLKAGEFPRFDLVLLGLGPEGHTASLFPDTAALEERKRLVVANWVEKFKTDRITLTLPVLNNAASVMFLVSGPEKAAIARDIFAGEGPPLPAQLILPSNGKLIWFLDEAAATELPSVEKNAS